MPQLSMHTPIGDLTISEEARAVVAIDWGWSSQQATTDFLRDVRSSLDRYFDGREITAPIPLAPAFGTAYQRRVWDALRRIPFGQTATYGAIADEVGGSARSVGNANGRNPIPILIPCHRVVAANGIGGYSGDGGTVTKRHLLAIERDGSRDGPRRGDRLGPPQTAQRSFL